jgi:Heterokaryon incompatibility protein (HET)
MIDSWLINCLDDHPQCRRSLTGIELDEHPLLPTRVIDVGSRDGRIPARLFISNGMRGKYVTLSHRWGSIKRQGLEDQRLSEFISAIPAESLTLTFRDTLEVARRLEIKYVWIDSLCIIQDSAGEADWLTEAVKMGQYFEHATCTIAAVDAIDDATSSDLGLFNSRQTDELAVRFRCDFAEDCNIPDLDGDDYHRLAFADNHRNRDFVLRPRWKGLHTMEDTPWYTRAWIVQERILSRRVIYYTKRKMFWECQMSEDEENLFDGDQISSMRTQLMSHLDELRAGQDQPSAVEIFEIAQAWNIYIEQYSSSQIKFEKDKLIAFQGVCDRVGTRLNQQISAGILLDGAGYNLLWHAQEASMLHVPSWSWAAIRGKVSFYGYFIKGEPNPQIQHLKVQRPQRCLKTGSAKCRDGICGLMSFTTTDFTATAAERLNSLGSYTNTALINIFGSCIQYQEMPMARMQSSALLPTPVRNVGIPLRAQVLRDNETNTIIRWFIRDIERHSHGLEKILCANVLFLKATEVTLARKALIPGFDYKHEENIDFIALEAQEDEACKPTHYRRVGRGRVVRNGWLKSCQRRDFLESERQYLLLSLTVRGCESNRTLYGLLRARTGLANRAQCQSLALPRSGRVVLPYGTDCER